MSMWAVLLGGLLLIPSAKADNGVVSADLAWLDKSLTVAREERAAGRMEAGAYQAFETKFRAQLAAAKTSMAPTAENIAFHARIVARLDGREQTVQNPGNIAAEPPGSDARLARGQKHLEAGDYSAALAEANAVLERDPTNKAALILKHNSAERGVSGAPSQPTADVQLPARKSIATTGPVKRAQPLPVAPPDPIPGPGPSSSTPLLPLAGAAGLGALAYTVSKRKSTVESTEGFDEEHRPPYGPGQQFVAGALLSALAGAVIYLTAEAAIPVVMRYSAQFGKPVVAEIETGEVEQIVIKKGETLNRVWHSDWKNIPNASRPEGLSYCRGSCLPINAAKAVSARGLNVGVNNNAQAGGLFRVTEDIVVTARRSIGGYDREILLHDPSDVKKLQLVSDSVSAIPPGK